MNRTRIVLLLLTLAVVVGVPVTAFTVAPDGHGFESAATQVGEATAECWIRLVDKHPPRRIRGPWWIEATSGNEFTVKGFYQGYSVDIGDGALSTQGFRGRNTFGYMSECDPVRTRLSDDCDEHITYLGEELPCLDPDQYPELDH